MSFIDFTIVEIKDLEDAILEYIKDNYKKESLELDAQSQLTNYINELDDDLYCMIEYPYVDKMYRDSYYSYYSSKHNEYNRDCIRITLFDTKIDFDDFRDINEKEKLQNSFRGFFVIRPTFSSIIGKSLIDKRAFIDDDFKICSYEGEISVNGVKLKVKGFPHSSQDHESISCAETTIWSVLEYFGNRYADYKPTYPSHIINILNKYSKQRLLPSNGLTVDQISFVLKEYGFGTSIYSRDDAYNEELENIISYYIESGIPVIAALENESIGHAIVIIGHENDEDLDVDSTPHQKLKFDEDDLDYIDNTDIRKRFIVNDDNLQPYRAIYLDTPVEHYPAGTEFEGARIQSIVVPLYKKIYLEVVKSKQLSLSILSDETLGYRPNNGFVFKHFLTSSRSFKEHIALQNDLNPTIKNIIILKKMPKFIWVTEIYNRDDFSSDVAEALILIDATEANEIGIDALILGVYPEKTIAKDDNKFVYLPTKFYIYNTFKNNLT